MNNIYVIVSNFNNVITSALLRGALKTFKNQKISIPDNHIVHVPGALELPITAQKIIEKHKPDAIIALGAVIEGATYHHIYVSNESIRGVMDVSLKTGTPIITGILTTKTYGQAEARAGKTLETNKGMQCAEACLEQLKVLKEI